LLALSVTGMRVGCWQGRRMSTIGTATTGSSSKSSWPRMARRSFISVIRWASAAIMSSSAPAGLMMRRTCPGQPISLSDPARPGRRKPGSTLTMRDPTTDLASLWPSTGSMPLWGLLLSTILARGLDPPISSSAAARAGRGRPGCWLRTAQQRTSLAYLSTWMVLVPQLARPITKRGIPLLPGRSICSGGTVQPGAKSKR